MTTKLNPIITLSLSLFIIASTLLPAAATAQVLGRTMVKKQKGSAAPAITVYTAADSCAQKLRIGGAYPENVYLKEYIT